MITTEDIEKYLKEALNIVSMEITDDSHLHAHHAEAKKSKGKHFTVNIVSDDFKDKKLIERHKLVYSALKSEMGTTIHALAIKAQTVEELKRV